ncbi:MAG TPA: hypothetical protein VFG02_06655, partial [Nitrospirota bacterium]|nr:hypothetical protein [Nitrospirota bacterium]
GYTPRIDNVINNCVLPGEYLKSCVGNTREADANKNYHCVYRSVHHGIKKARPGICGTGS